MYILRALTNDGDILLGVYEHLDELKTTMWSVNNLVDYENLFDDRSPYYYYNVY